MPKYKVTIDGKSYAVTVPEGQTERHAYVYAKRQAGPKKKNLGDNIADFARGVTDSATLGFADEIGAGIDTLTGLRSGGRDYEANLRNRRQIASEGGGARLAGQVAGGLALPMGKAAALAKGAKAWLGAAGIGAGYGAAYEAGSAEGGLAERAKAVPRGLAYGAAGGVAGRALASGAARALRGKQFAPDDVAGQAIRKLADEGVVMTPGQRGGKVARTMEETVLGSIPFVKSVPQAAARRGVEQFNVAAYNRVLAPLGQKLPKGTAPGTQAVDQLNDTVLSAYDNAASSLTLRADKPLATAAQRIVKGGSRTVGKDAGQLQAIVYDTLSDIQQGLSGGRVRDVLQDLRGNASAFIKSPVANERNMGKELWKFHDQIESALLRQNAGDVVGQFKLARESTKLMKRVNSAAGKSPDGIFNPTQFRQAVTKSGYGVTPDKVARGKAPMQDLADAAKQILPAQVPNSGSPERALGIASLSGPGLGAFVDPYLGSAAGASLLRYVPGVDRALQNFALNRPRSLVLGGNALEAASPYFAIPGSLAAIQQGN